ncbi:MAG: hypothetical protein P9E24_11540 [Candidatus Competibacter sp.]|nr:hypothetical protein [Candidatus Competibacter sp.]MDG4584436.1 hypothetical protein [Candidatus Competibacter sp.]
MNAKEILDSIQDVPNILVSNGAFYDPKSGITFKVFYTLEGNLKRRCLIGVTEELEEDELTSPRDAKNLIMLVEKKLSDFREKTKNQTNKFEREKDFVFTRFI